VDDELARDGDAVRRACRAHDAAALSAVVLTEQECKGFPTHRTVRHLGVGLPRRQHDITAPPDSARVGLRGRHRGRRRRGRQRAGGGRRRVQHNGVCGGGAGGARVHADARRAAHGRLGRGQAALAVGAAARGRRVGTRGAVRKRVSRGGGGGGEGRGVRGQRGGVGAGAWTIRKKVHPRFLLAPTPRLLGDIVCIARAAEAPVQVHALALARRRGAARGAVELVLHRRVPRGVRPGLRRAVVRRHGKRPLVEGECGRDIGWRKGGGQRPSAPGTVVCTW
jgi:hypothetical protein